MDDNKNSTNNDIELEINASIPDINELVPAEDYIKLIENSRFRIRNLAQVTITICGMLTSSAFVVIFFLLNSLKENPDKFTIAVPFLIICAIFLLLSSIIFSILSIHTSKRFVTPTKIQFVDSLQKIYFKEHKMGSVSIVFLILAIILFSTSMVIFSIQIYMT